MKLFLQNHSANISREEPREQTPPCQPAPTSQRTEQPSFLRSWNYIVLLNVFMNRELLLAGWNVQAVILYLWWFWKTEPLRIPREERSSIICSITKNCPQTHYLWWTANGHFPKPKRAGKKMTTDVFSSDLKRYQKDFLNQHFNVLFTFFFS